MDFSDPVYFLGCLVLALTMSNREKVPMSSGSIEVDVGGRQKNQGKTQVKEERKTGPRKTRGSMVFSWLSTTRRDPRLSKTRRKMECVDLL